MTSRKCKAILRAYILELNEHGVNPTFLALNVQLRKYSKKSVHLRKRGMVTTLSAQPSSAVKNSLSAKAAPINAGEERHCLHVARGCCSVCLHQTHPVQSQA